MPIFNSTATRGLSLEAGYWSADLFIQILKKAGKNLTRERFIAAGNDNFSYDGQNATADAQWPTGHTESISGLTLVLGNGTGYSVVVPFTNLKSIDNKDRAKKIAGK